IQFRRLNIGTLLRGLNHIAVWRGALWLWFENRAQPRELTRDHFAIADDDDRGALRHEVPLRHRLNVPRRYGIDAVDERPEVVRVHAVQLLPRERRHETFGRRVLREEYPGHEGLKAAQLC